MGIPFKILKLFLSTITSDEGVDRKKLQHWMTPQNYESFISNIKYINLYK